MKPFMFGLGGMGQEAFIYVLWHKSHVNMSIMGFESTVWGLLKPDDNLKRQKVFLYIVLLSSGSTEVRTGFDQCLEFTDTFLSAIRKCRPCPSERPEEHRSSWYSLPTLS